jgi:hypothetical protein
MAQDLTVNIKTTSDVPQAMDRAKAATVSFDRQVTDISRKFSTAFKDIFLGFTAPMVLIQSAISYINAAMEQAKRDAKEGLDLIAQGETKFASSEEARTAAFFKRRKELEEERRLVQEGRASLTEQIISDPELAKGFILPQRIMQRLQAGESIKGVARDEELGRMAMEYLQQTEKGRKILAESTPAETARQTNFKTPEGFSNVVGVGANPVIEAMNAQLEETKKTNMLLESIASGQNTSDGWITSPAPSRAAMLNSK